MLNVKNLGVQFKKEDSKSWISTVNGVSFNLEKGKVLGIVGESGSGKSVTAFSLMRLHQQSNTRIQGEIEFKGINLMQLSEGEIRKYRGNRISIIFQEPMTSLNPVISCGEQVMEAILQHQKTNRQKAKIHCLQLFEEVQLPMPERIFKSYPHQLSGGQKQRVMIAMALSCNPELLIADEPTTALDVTVQKTILQLLFKLKEEREMAMIFISHDLGVVREIADEVAVMYKGKIVEHGPVKELFKNPQHRYTKALLASRPVLDKKLKILPTVADFTTNIQTENPSVLSKENIYTQEEIEQRRTILFAGKPLLKVNDLCTWFPVKHGLFGKNGTPVKAVDGVTFEVFPGETVGLVGESGCGKTTLGRSILRLTEPSSGQILYKDTDLRKLDKKALRSLRKNIQIIFQDPYSALNPRMTAGQAIQEPMQVHKMYGNEESRKKEVCKLLEKVGLQPEHYQRYPHEFSGGQRQRIVIARALALQPEFIICDESVSALDVSVQAQVLNLLKQLQLELGLTYIFISHDLAVVKHLSDRILIMNKGKIEEQGFPEDIYAHPKADYTKKLIAAIPGL